MRQTRCADFFIPSAEAYLVPSCSVCSSTFALTSSHRLVKPCGLCRHKRLGLGQRYKLPLDPPSLPKPGLTPCCAQTFAVDIASQHETRPRTVQFILAQQVDPPIPSSGVWRRESCTIESEADGHNELFIPTELAVTATLRRLQPVFDCPAYGRSQGFTENHPPPLPHDLLALHAECQVQLALDDLRCSSAGFLSRTAWQRDISRLMSAHEYAERAERLRAILVASTPARVDGEQPLNRLVWEAAVMEDELCGAPAEGVSEEERNRSAKRQLAKLVLGWKDVVELLGRLFSVSRSSSFIQWPD